MNLQQLMRAISVAFAKEGADHAFLTAGEFDSSDVSDKMIKNIYKTKVLVHDGSNDYHITQVYIQNGARLVINIGLPRKESKIPGKDVRR